MVVDENKENTEGQILGGQPRLNIKGNKFRVTEEGEAPITDADGNVIGRAPFSRIDSLVKVLSKGIKPGKN